MPSFSILKKETFDKTTCQKVLKQIEFMCIQGRILDLIRALISKRLIYVTFGITPSQSRHTDLKVLHGNVMSATLIFVTINAILGELVIEMNDLLFCRKPSNIYPNKKSKSGN